MGVEVRPRHGRSYVATYSAIAATVVLLLAVAIAAIRWNTHRARTAELSRAADVASSQARAYSAAVHDLENAEKRTGMRYVSAFTAIENISKNGFGYMAVAKERLDALRVDKDIDNAIQAARGRFPHSDAVFDTRIDEALRREQAVKDQITSLSAMMGAIVNNPIVALGLSAADARSAGYRFGKASADFAHSWEAVKNRARHLRDESAVRARDAETRVRVQRRKSPLAAVLDP